MTLLEPIQLAGHTLNNKMVMAAMTRSRADRNGIVGPMTQDYYAQRAGAGLIISEGINISAQALGSPFTPGLFTQAHIDAWQQVTKAVHDKGGRIFAQLWHTGRVGHSVDRNGALPVAPSAIAITSMQHFTAEGLKDFDVPQALSIDDIHQIIRDYGQAAQNALEAGFDGVALHAANGYLPNQFLADSANQRNDEYGGNIENRCRFILELMQHLIHTVGAQRVGIKISPFNPYADIVMAEPVSTYQYLIAALNQLQPAFLEIMKRSPMFPLLPHYPTDDEISLFGPDATMPVMANGGYDQHSAEAELDRGIASLISFGVAFLANPDLPTRFARNAALNPADRHTFFGGNEKGYTDYPFLHDK
jgi:N-ethylmaleimide reductase